MLHNISCQVCQNLICFNELAYLKHVLLLTESNILHLESNFDIRSGFIKYFDIDDTTARYQSLSSNLTYQVEELEIHHVNMSVQ